MSQKRSRPRRRQVVPDPPEHRYEPTGQGWRPPFYTPRVEYVWFDGQRPLRQQPIVACPGRGLVFVYTEEDGEIRLDRWRVKAATTMYWLGCVSRKNLLAESLIDESKAITASIEARPAENPAYYRREARKKRQRAESLGRLLHHLRVAIRRAVG